MSCSSIADGWRGRCGRSDAEAPPKTHTHVGRRAGTLCVHTFRTSCSSIADGSSGRCGQGDAEARPLPPLPPSPNIQVYHSVGTQTRIVQWPPFSTMTSSGA
eukprot:347792-Chlamydomonas_euryale.AAC.1